MNKMKKYLAFGVTGLMAVLAPILLTTLTVAPVAMTGCSSLGGGGTNDQATIDATALILQNTARAGTLVAITPPTGDTNNAAYFELAAQTIGVFLTGKDYSPAAFQKALLDINVPSANNVWVQLGIGAVIDLYQVYFSQYVQGQINGNFAAGTFLLAVQNGFNQALGHPTTLAAGRPQLRAGQPFVSNVLPRPIKK